MSTAAHQTAPPAHSESHAPPSQTDPKEIVKSLTPDLVETLAILDGAPRGIPELTTATLGLGSRVTLRALGIVDYKDGDTEGTTLTVTKLGHQVIAECASERSTSPSVAAALQAAREELLAAS